MFSRKSKADKEQERMEREHAENQRRQREETNKSIENRNKILAKHRERLQPELTDKSIIFFAYSKNDNVVVALFQDRIRLRSFQKSIINTGLRGEKSIYLNRISSVQFKEPGLSTGYIQFKTGGEGESRSSTLDAVKDENAVIFNQDQLVEFRRMRDLVEDQIQKVNSPGSQSTPNTSAADELMKLADLRDRGVLSEAEFLVQKAKILGS